jgi:hypothetical protein
MTEFLIVLVVSSAIFSIVKIMRKGKKKDVGVTSLINNIEKISQKRKK